MAEVDFDRVEPGLDRESRRGGMVFDDTVDVLAGGPLGELEGRRIEQPHWRQCLPSKRPEMCDGSGVADLRADGRTFGVDGVGQLLQPRDGLWAPPDLVEVGTPIR